ENPFEKIKRNVKESSPQVKQGLIGLAGLFLVTGITTVVTLIQNSGLRAKVHDLEQEVQPFRNLAVQQFNKADVESMKQLAESMSALKKDYTEQLKKTRALEKEIEGLKNSNAEADEAIRIFQRKV